MNLQPLMIKQIDRQTDR